MDFAQPTMTCPRCKREEPDFDGVGMLAHTKPAYEHGCGYCTHASRTGGVCDYCGDASWRLTTLDIPGTTELAAVPFTDEAAARQAFAEAAEDAKAKGGHLKLLNPRGECVATFVRVKP